MNEQSKAHLENVLRSRYDATNRTKITITPVNGLEQEAAYYEVADTLDLWESDGTETRTYYGFAIAHNEGIELFSSPGKIWP